MDFEETLPDLFPKIGASPELLNDSSFHLARGLAREGNRENVARARALFDETDEAFDEDTRLAGTG